MKLIQRLSGGLVAFAIAAALSAQAEEGIAKVVNINGAGARYATDLSSGTPNWRPLKTGAVLKPGTVVQTAAGTYVDVVLNNANATAADTAAFGAAASSLAGDGTSSVSSAEPKAQQDAVRIYENTVLGLDKLNVTQTGADKVTETQLDLKAGRILGSVKKLSATSTYEVKIPNGVAGIRGTIYSISANGVLNVLSGSVVIAFVGPDGTPVTKEVKAGQQFDPKTGLIGQIPPRERGPLMQDAQALGKGNPKMPPTTLVGPDKTIYYVSPVTPKND